MRSWNEIRIRIVRPPIRGCWRGRRRWQHGGVQGHDLGVGTSDEGRTMCSNDTPMGYIPMGYPSSRMRLMSIKWLLRRKRTWLLSLLMIKFSCEKKDIKMNWFALTYLIKYSKIGVLGKHSALWTRPWRNFFQYFEIMVSNFSMNPETLFEHG